MLPRIIDKKSCFISKRPLDILQSTSYLDYYSFIYESPMLFYTELKACFFQSIHLTRDGYMQILQFNLFNRLAFQTIHMTEPNTTAMEIHWEVDNSHTPLTESARKNSNTKRVIPYRIP